jgi:glycosyltransferase involved in cell wall biosynthesis
VRIAIVAPPWVPVPPPAYGGTELVLDVMARGLSAQGHDVLLCATGDSTCPVEVRWAYEHALGTVTATSQAELRHVIHAYDAISDWQADIVHDHTLIGPVYGTRLGLPVVTTNHGPFVGELGDLYRAISAFAPVIAISHDQAEDAGPGIALAGVIHHGVETEAIPVGAGAGGFALFLGRMSPHKAPDVAVRVARAAGVPLKLAAKLREPAEQEYFDDRVKPLLGSTAEYLGEVRREEKLQLLGDAVCLLNPIAWPEPFGIVMIEALACGTPVVATPCGSVPELIDDGVTGFVRSGTDALADAIRHVDELDRDVCRKVVDTRFSADRMVAEHVALYEQVLRERDATSGAEALAALA